MTKLRDAVIKGDMETLQLTYTHGNPKEFREVDSVTGNTLLHDLADAFEPGSSYPVSEDRRMAVTKFLVETAKLDIKIKNNNMETALDIANRKYGKTNLLSKYFGLQEPTLLSRFTVIEREDFRTHLFDFIKSGDLQAFQKELTTIGGDFDVAELTDASGNTLLMAAIQEKKRSFIIILLNNKQIKWKFSAKNVEGKTAFDLVEDLETETLLRNAELAQDN